MKLIGITGGIGMGKSTAGKLLQKRGFPVIDTDTIARDIVEPGQPALEEIVKSFGGGMLDSRGKLQRHELARIVFSNDRARQELETILHPRIRAVWQREVERWREKDAQHGFVLIPLLFETNAAPSFHATICVACSERSQGERLKARGWSDDEIVRRKAAQWPVQKKMDASNYVVWTDTAVDIHEAQLDQILRIA